MRLRPAALGIALGLVWGTSLFVSTWLSYFTGYGRLFLDVLAGSIYPGYTITTFGSVVGFGYGFLDGFVSASLIGWIYNRLSR